MGIPRLTQDLQPYLEGAVLAAPKLHDGRVEIDSVIIDGPSMVYHIYNKLTAYLWAHSAAGPGSFPSYSQLVVATRHFLQDLESCGVSIKHIFFDGALPPSKRPVRLDRLEKSRTALETRRIASSDVGFSDATQLSFDLQQYSAALWKTDIPSSRISGWNLPFIVPTVIDALRKSSWAGVISIVPYEAEVACALLAGWDNDAAILTNDSDLVLFKDLSQRGVIVILNTLVLQRNGGITKPVLEARCWRPSQISDQTNIENILLLGFERSKDPTASSGTILQRARLLGLREEKNGFAEFAEQYCATNVNDSRYGKHADLNYFDPRFAEVAVQLCQCLGNLSDSSTEYADVYSYLPVVLEDPMRDSSWSLGISLRKTAYSLLTKHLLGKEHEKHRIRVLEHYRKGQRIACDTIAITTTAPQSLSVAEVSQALRKWISIETDLGTANGISSFSSILFALEWVRTERERLGKRHFPREVYACLLGLKGTGKSPHANPRTISEDDWTVMHLSANVQAVLYSLRMLKQVICLVSKQYASGCANGYPQNGLQILMSLPNLCTLQLSPAEMRRLFLWVPHYPRTRMLDFLLQDSSIPPVITDDKTKLQKPRAATITDHNRARAVSNDSLEFRDASYTTNSKRKRKRKQKGSFELQKKKGAVQVKKLQSSNPFALLEDAD